ncbi:PREDICTED: keratin-associated protein 19-2 [Rhagoletis zephyria]|uniref:keratin-associated protein 19-2 n=1 Tax=Rhagoletis zephyria TaxID=28612 RepID=UPI0008118E44|nr:PREDICTED: keratin-associated protein 19-2 [Rhagoletis zephyria]XP_036339035.1 keratin-associated protein 19-2-like [Rhagoletis pomonella]
MKCAALITAIVLATLCAATTTTYAESVLDNAAIAASTNDEQLDAAASSLNPLEDTHKQEKRYVGGTWDPYSSRLGLGLEGSSLYNSGYGGYGNYAGYSGLGGLGTAGYGGYGAYGGYGNNAGYGSAAGYGPYGGYGSPYSYYNARFGGGYPYSRLGYNYPSSYYSGYSNSVVGGGLGALGAGVVPPVAGVGGAGGYQYGPGISGTVY